MNRRDQGRGGRQVKGQGTKGMAKLSNSVSPERRKEEKKGDTALLHRVRPSWVPLSFHGSFPVVTLQKFSKRICETGYLSVRTCNISMRCTQATPSIAPCFACSSYFLSSTVFLFFQIRLSRTSDILIPSPLFPTLFTLLFPLSLCGHPVFL